MFIVQRCYYSYQGPPKKESIVDGMSLAYDNYQLHPFTDLFEEHFAWTSAGTFGSYVRMAQRSVA